MPLGDLCGKFCWLRVGNELESQGMHSQPLLVMPSCFPQWLHQLTLPGAVYEVSMPIFITVSL